MLEYPNPSSASDLLVLSGKEPFARGGKRHCYVHPGDSTLCVKVAARAEGEDCHAQQRLDLEDYALLKMRGRESVFERIPEIAGVVDTDLGPGIVMQLYRDADGRISRRLAEVVRERGLTPSLIRADRRIQGVAAATTLADLGHGSAQCPGRESGRRRLEAGDHRRLAASQAPLACSDPSLDRGIPGRPAAAQIRPARGILGKEAPRRILSGGR